MDVSNSAAAFDSVAETYDADFGQNPIGILMRERVWETCLKVFKPGDTVLDLNAGTGIDATFLAQNGIYVHAVDISPRMIYQLEQKVIRLGLRERVTSQVAALENLAGFGGKLFDGALSNFGGLNCVKDFPAVVRSISKLLQPGAPLVVCLLSKFYLMEILAFVRRGKIGLAFRRWKTDGSHANIGGQKLRVQYPSLRQICQDFSPFFEIESIEGLGIVLPPTWATGRTATSKTPLRFLSIVDRGIGRFPILRSLGDHVLLQLRRR